MSFQPNLSKFNIAQHHSNSDHRPNLLDTTNLEDALKELDISVPDHDPLRLVQAQPEVSLDKRVTNYDTVSPLAGEQQEMWMYATQVEAEINNIQRCYPNLPRSEVVDRWRALKMQHSRGIGSKIVSRDKPSTQASEKAAVGGLKDETKVSKTSKDRAPMYKRISAFPVLLEMLIANKDCVYPLTKLISKSAVQSLLNPLSGSFAAHFWMDMELLQRLTNVSGTLALTEARTFVTENPDLQAAGFTGSIKIWQDLHLERQQLPEAIRLYDNKIATIFDKCSTALNLGKDGDTAYLENPQDTEAVNLAVRSVFEAFGTQLENQKVGCFVSMGVLARLYARLPSWDVSKEGRAIARANGAHDHDFFYNRALLPTPATAARWVRLSTMLHGKDSGAGAEFLEYLIDRHKPMWVLGSADSTTRLCSNWYNSGRGTLHAALRFVPGRPLDKNTGCIIGRFSSLLTWHDDHRFVNAIRFIDNAVDPAHRIASMRAPYGAGRKEGLGRKVSDKEEKRSTANKIKDTGLTESVLNTFQHRFRLTGYSTAGELLDALRNVGVAEIRKYIKSGTPTDMSAILQNHPCLKVVSDRFWQTAPIIWWGSSWDIKDKNSLIPACAIGWGLLLDAYELLVVEHLLLHRRVYWLIRFANVVCDDGDGTWWGHYFGLKRLRQERRKLLQATKEQVPSDTEQESGSDLDADSNCYSLPFTGYDDSRIHISKPRRCKAEPLGETSDMHQSEPTLPGSPRTSDNHSPQETSAPESSAAETSVSCTTSPHPPPFTPTRDNNIPSPQAGSLTPVTLELHCPTGYAPSEQCTYSQEETPDQLPPPNAFAVQQKSPSAFSSSSGGFQGLLDQGLDRCSSPLVLDTAAARPLLCVGSPETTLGSCQLPLTLLQISIIPEDDSLYSNEVASVRLSFDNAKLDTLRQQGYNVTEHLAPIKKALMIPGLFVCGFLSDRLLPGYEGQLYFHPPRECGQIKKEIMAAGSLTHKALVAAFEARQQLRADLINAARMATKMSDPTTYFTDSLAPQLYHLKISYVKNLAIRLSELDIPIEDALAEASFVASTDNLFTCEVLDWRDNGDVFIEVGGTFPMGKSKLATKFYLGTIQPHQNHTDVRRFLSMVTQTVPTIQGIVPDQNMAHEFGYDIRQGSYKGEDHAAAKMVGLKRTELPRTFQSATSCLSGGDFCRDFPWLLTITDKQCSHKSLLVLLLRWKKALETLFYVLKSADESDWERNLRMLDDCKLYWPPLEPAPITQLEATTTSYSPMSEDLSGSVQGVGRSNQTEQSAAKLQDLLDLDALPAFSPISPASSPILPVSSPISQCFELDMFLTDSDRSSSASPQHQNYEAYEPRTHSQPEYEEIDTQAHILLPMGLQHQQAPVYSQQQHIGGNSRARIPPPISLQSQQVPVHSQQQHVGGHSRARIPPPLAISSQSQQVPIHSQQQHVGANSRARIPPPAQVGFQNQHSSSLATSRQGKRRRMTISPEDKTKSTRPRTNRDSE